MLYTLRFFSSKCSLFHNSNFLVPVLFTFYIQVVLKLKKNNNNNSGAKRLTNLMHKIFTYLLTYILTYLLTYLLTYIQTYLHN